MVASNLVKTKRTLTDELPTRLCLGPQISFLKSAKQMHQALHVMYLHSDFGVSLAALMAVSALS